MPLDITTLYVVAAIGSLIAGVIHVLPWTTGRFGLWSAYWGLGHLVMGTVSLFALLYAQAAIGSWIIRLSNSMAVAGFTLILAGARTFELPSARVAPIFVVGLMFGLPLLFSVDPSHFHYRVAYMGVVRALVDGTIVYLAIRIARHEQVHTGWIVAMLFAATVPLFLGRSYLALLDQIGRRPAAINSGLAGWLAAAQITFVLFRAFSLLLLEAERGQKALADQMCRDPLTGALNRFGFERLVAKRTGPVCAMMIDIDHFKQLNDRYGHAAGDAALRRLADVAQEMLGTRGTLIRWGGDEFICLLPGLDDRQAAPIAEGISARFTQAVRAVIPDTSHSVSIGHATGRFDDRIDDLLGRADSAMYVAKRSQPPSPYVSVG